MIGTGNVEGNFRVDSEENGKWVDDKPCKVKGKSLKSAVSGGLISTWLSASNADFSPTPLC